MLSIRVIRVVLGLFILFVVQECFDLDWGANKDAEMMQTTLSKSHQLTEQAEMIASGQAPTLALYRYEGQGTFTYNSKFHENTNSCSTAYSVYAIIDQNDVVRIYGGGACFENFSKCSLSTDPNNRCAIEAKGVKEGLESVNLTFCNTDKVSINSDAIIWSEENIEGSFSCLIPGDNPDDPTTISLSFDLPRVPWK
jgi:hypothetical protein